MAYDSKAQDFAYSYYARGYSRDRAVREVQKVYGGFSKSTWDDWEAKLGWRERRALADAKLREFEDLAQNTAKVILLSLEGVRQRIHDQIDKASELDTQIVYAYNSVCKQISEISARHMDGRDNVKIAMETLSRAFEALLQKMQTIEPLRKALEANATSIAAMLEEVAEEFGREA